MKLLNGRELADFIKERQAKEVRRLSQALGVKPRLAIVQTKKDSVIDTYVNLKRIYGNDIGVGVDHYFVNQSEIEPHIAKLNQDNSIHGIIVQLPLEKSEETDKIVDLVSPDKDVDALGSAAKFEPATPMAIMWLLSGYNVEFRGKHVLLIGRGKLVGAPLERRLKDSGYDVEVVDRSASDLTSHTMNADIVITATGSPAIIYPDMIKQGAVVVDAGVASESGKTVGDLHESVYSRDDLTVTPLKGGVGPLTVCALFENVILAAKHSTLSNTRL